MSYAIISRFSPLRGKARANESARRDELFRRLSVAFFVSAQIRQILDSFVRFRTARAPGCRLDSQENELWLLKARLTRRSAFLGELRSAVSLERGEKWKHQPDWQCASRPTARTESVLRASPLSRSTADAW